MAKQLIHDVVPPTEAHQEYEASKLSTSVLIRELHNRRTSIEEIFAAYYAIEAAADDRDDQLFGNDESGQHGKPTVLTVGDVQLAGHAELPKKPVERQPF